MKKLVLILGKSGSGKSYLQDLLLNKGFFKVMSATTRKPRSGETNEYLFLSEDEFHKMVMLEKASFAGNYYGTPLDELNKKGDMVKVIEPQGCSSLLKYLKKNQIELDVIILFLDIPEKQLRINMKKRGDSASDIEKRLKQDSIKKDFLALNLNFYRITEIDIDEIMEIIYGTEN